MLRCVSSRAGAVLDDAPASKSRNLHASGVPPRCPPPEDVKYSSIPPAKPAYKAPSSPAAVPITATSGPPPPPQPPSQLAPGDAPALPLFGGPNALDERKLDLWTRASSNTQLWDLQLRTTIDGEMIHSNTLDLAAVSPFFYKLLSSGKVERMTSMEGQEGLRVIKVDGIRGSTLRFAVQAIYAREVAINWRNCEECLDLADKLSIRALRDACAAFLMEFLAAEPRLAWTLSTKYKCDKVRAAVRKHVVKNFDSIVMSRGGSRLLKAIAHKELASVLNDDALSLHSEMLIVKAVEGMLLVEREEKFADSHDYTALLLAMRVEHLDPQHLNEALCSPAVQGCPRVVARFANVALFHASHIELDFPPRATRESTWYTWRLDGKLTGGKARSGAFAIPGSDEKWCLVATGDGAGKDGQLAVFLSVAGEPAEAWRERVSFTIRLVNQTAPMRSIERGLDNEVLDSSRKVWGYKSYTPMNNIRDPRTGFAAIDGTIVLQVQARSLPLDKVPSLRKDFANEASAGGSPGVSLGAGGQESFQVA